MQNSFFILATDESIGKIDQTMLTDQIRMELLIEGLTEKSKSDYKNEEGDYLDIQNWNSVGLNEKGNVKEIRLKDWYRTEGSIALEYMPKTVESFVVNGVKADGTIETSRIPQAMCFFGIIDTKMFHGTFHFSTLPENLILCNISGNAFTGSVDLTRLPQNLTELMLADNAFFGNVSLEHLPPLLSNLNIAKNAFSGTLCLSKLPQSLTHFKVHECQFSGSVTFENLPKELYILKLNGNNFTGRLIVDQELYSVGVANFSDNAFLGTALVHSSFLCEANIARNCITSVVDETGRSYECTFGKEGYVQMIETEIALDFDSYA